MDKCAHCGKVVKGAWNGGIDPGDRVYHTRCFKCVLPTLGDTQWDYWASHILVPADPKRRWGKWPRYGTGPVLPQLILKNASNGLRHFSAQNREILA
eukprot:3294980-Prymnesium_polylepis.1